MVLKPWFPKVYLQAVKMCTCTLASILIWAMGPGFQGCNLLTERQFGNCLDKPCPFVFKLLASNLLSLETRQHSLSSTRDLADGKLRVNFMSVPNVMFK